jgi:hypothetical protein
MARYAAIDLSDRAALADEGLPQFTAREETFLRAYSESLSRVQAMVASGLARDDALDVGTEAQQEALSKAGAILGRAEHMPIQEIASAVGADRIYFVVLLKRVCESGKLHEAIKGLQILARVHGIWDPYERARGRRGRGIQFLTPKGPEEAKNVTSNGLPFTLPEK